MLSEHNQPPPIPQHQVLQGCNALTPVNQQDQMEYQLKSCVHHLAAVFTTILNCSLHQVLVATCLKTATIIPVPPSTAISRLNNYWSVALMASQDLHPTWQHQFAYRSKSFTHDAIAITLHSFFYFFINHNETPGHMSGDFLMTSD